MIEKATLIEQEDATLKAAIFGPPGCGKTVFGASGGRVLLLDCDGTGASSLLNHPQFRGLVKRIRVRRQEEVMEVFHDLRRDSSAFDTVMIDTLSMLQGNDLQYILNLAAKANPQKYHKYKAQLQDYGESTNRMRDVCSSYCDLPINVLFMLHELRESEEGSDDTTIYIRPALTPKLAASLHGLVDLTGYMTCEVQKDGSELRKLRVKATRRITAKTRVHFPTPELVDPSFEQLLTAKKELVRLAQAASN